MENLCDRLTSDRYQNVRLFDVFVLAPSMVYASTSTQLPDHVRYILFVSGIGTLVFNGINYLEINKQ